MLWGDPGVQGIYTRGRGVRGVLYGLWCISVQGGYNSIVSLGKDVTHNYPKEIKDV
jgi:hypothetical protein